jgi:hypothetical protein
MSEVSGNQIEEMMDLVAMHDEELHPDLVPWLAEVNGWPMLRHPLVVQAFPVNGLANRAYAHKREQLAEALTDEDWGTVVFLHERGYRLGALIEYVTGRDEEGRPLPLYSLSMQPGYEDVCNLVADVWVDSENISQMIEDWRALFDTARDFWLGTHDERLAFSALPDPIRAYRAGIDDGDWSWTTDRKIAEFFARRFVKDGEKPVLIVHRDIPKSRCFGYLTRRSEAELLVRLDPS